MFREEKATTTLWVVYDGFAKNNGPDCLYAGPKFGQNTMDIMLRFCVQKVAADFEKAFLMIAILPEDRDALHLFWVDNVNKQILNVVILRFICVIFGVSSTLLNATIRHHMERYVVSLPEFVKKFLRSIYVDNVSYGADDVDLAYE